MSRFTACRADLDQCCASLRDQLVVLAEFRPDHLNEIIEYLGKQAETARGDKRIIAHAALVGIYGACLDDAEAVESGGGG